MLVDRPKQHFMVDVFKQSFDVKLHNPLVAPAPLARDPYSSQGRFPRPVALGVWQKDRLHRWLKRHLDYPLGHSVCNGGHASDAFPTRLLRNGHRFHRGWEITP
jgi:hypothetical protein